jgi:hypothetical protein
MQGIISSNKEYKDAKLRLIIMQIEDRIANKIKRRNEIESRKLQ